MMIIMQILLNGAYNAFANSPTGLTTPIAVSGIQHVAFNEPLDERLAHDPG